jgi:hypothetical protein
MHSIIRAKSDDVALRAISLGINGSIRSRASMSSAGLVCVSDDSSATISGAGNALAAPGSTKVPLPTVCVIRPSGPSGPAKRA